MNDSFFKEDLDEKIVLEENNEAQDEKNISSEKGALNKINNRFSNDRTNVKIVLAVGVLALVLGVWHLVSGIKNAFVFSPIVLEDKAGAIDSLNRIKDTDNDGLSDYDEKYVYGTSPYLSDSDSDGVSDYDEIMTGDLPLCAGDTCEESLAEVDSSDLLDTEVQQIMTLEELKQSLIDAGYPASEVEKLSEADLNLIYAEVQKAVDNENYTFTGLDNNQGEENTPSAEELEQLQNLSIDQIKELLIQGGATVEQLESISDEELKRLYIEALRSL